MLFFFSELKCNQEKVHYIFWKIKQFTADVSKTGAVFQGLPIIHCLNIGSYPSLELYSMNMKVSTKSVFFN